MYTNAYNVSRLARSTGIDHHITLAASGDKVVGSIRRAKDLAGLEVCSSRSRSGENTGDENSEGDEKLHDECGCLGWVVKGLKLELQR